MTASPDERFRVLAVDDQEPLLRALCRQMAPLGFDITPFTDPGEALQRLEGDPHDFDVIALDVHMPTLDGLEVLLRSRRIDPELAVVMVTGDREAETAVKALQSGAFHYLIKPIQNVADAAAILRAAATQTRLARKVRTLQAELERGDGFEEMIGSSEAIREVYAIIDRVGPLDMSALIVGESGTGKELAARAIHARSARRAGPFVALNCAALPETLVDAELFGHARGAFTGAVEARAGVFERADGGTLFLDEIGDVPPSVQLRLLRVLQEREVMRLGAKESKKIDVRVIAATLVDLEQAVDLGEFRPDLYYRLNVVNLRLPPLRERRDDIGLLAAHLLEKHAVRLGIAAPRLTPEALARLFAYDWPGNVRELENAMQRALALSPGGEIAIDALPSPAADSAARAGGEPLAESLDWAREMTITEARARVAEDFERRYVEALLRETDGNISESARQAGVDRSNFRRIMNRLGIKASG